MFTTALAFLFLVKLFSRPIFMLLKILIKFIVFWAYNLESFYEVFTKFFVKTPNFNNVRKVDIEKIQNLVKTFILQNY